MLKRRIKRYAFGYALISMAVVSLFIAIPAMDVAFGWGSKPTPPPGTRVVDCRDYQRPLGGGCKGLQPDFICLGDDDVWRTCGVGYNGTICACVGNPFQTSTPMSMD